MNGCEEKVMHYYLRELYLDNGHVIADYVESTDILPAFESSLQADVYRTEYPTKEAALAVLPEVRRLCTNA